MILAQPQIPQPRLQFLELDCMDVAAMRHITPQTHAAGPDCQPEFKPEFKDVIE